MPLVTVERSFSISAGLAASTVTPGSTRARVVFDGAGDGAGLRRRKRRREDNTSEHEQFEP